MKNLWISVKITLAMCLLLGVGYVLVLRGVSALAGPNGGQAETLTLDGRVVGAANVGQQFTGGRYFWGRPSAVDYNGGGPADPHRPCHRQWRLDQDLGQAAVLPGRRGAGFHA